MGPKTRSSAKSAAGAVDSELPIGMGNSEPSEEAAAKSEPSPERQSEKKKKKSKRKTGDLIAKPETPFLNSHPQGVEEELASGLTFFEASVRSHLSHQFKVNEELKLSTIRLVGRRNLRRPGQNFGLFNENIAGKLASCIDRLSASLAISRTGRLTVESRSCINLSLMDCMVTPIALAECKFSLRWLKRLDLSENPIGSLGAIVLAESISSDCRLESLKLVNCQLVDLYVSKMRLHGVLDLEGFRQLMFALALNTTLKTLDLSCNYLGGTARWQSSAPRTYGYDYGYQHHEEYGTDTMNILVYYLALNTTIRQLNILSNGYDDSFVLANSFIRAVCKHPTCTSLCGSDSHRLTARRAIRQHANHLALLSIPNLKSPPPPPIFAPTLSYRGCCLSPFSGRLLGNESCLFVDIVVLDLSDNCDFGDGLLYLCDALLKPSTRSSLALRELELRKIGATAVGAASLAQLLNIAPIRRVDVSENPAIGDRGVEGLTKLLWHNKSLQSLTMREVGLTASGMPAINHLLLKNSTLTALDMGQNAVKCAGLACIETGLRANKVLVSLSMGDAEIQPTGAMMWAALLLSSGLQSLDLSSNVMCGRRSENSFDPKPVIHIGESLHVANRTLTSLNMSKADIGARSTRRLMLALVANPIMRTLIIDSCNISEEGAAHVGEALPDLINLETLQISACNVGPIGCARVFLGLIHNTSITSLDMSGNQLTGYMYGESANLIDFDISAVGAIGAGLARNAALRYLNLSNNRKVVIITVLLFGLSQDRHIGTEGNLNTTAIGLIAQGIEQNGRNGGRLQVVSLLQNRLSSNYEQTCKACVHNFKQNWDQCHLGSEKQNVLRYSMNSAACERCKGSFEVTALLDAAASHPHLTSLLGITPSQRHLELSSLRCCDQYMRLLYFELRNSHVIESIDLDNNCLTTRGFEILLGAVEESLSLSSLHLSVDEVNGCVEKKEVCADAQAKSLSLESAVKRSFHYRVATAIFIHGFSCLGAAPCRAILEYTIGCGPLVGRFLRHRVVWNDWSVRRIRSSGGSDEDDFAGNKRRSELMESPQPISEEEKATTRRRLTYYG